MTKGTEMNENGVGYYHESPWGWREKMSFRLFPSTPCPLPMAPATHLDCVTICTVVGLSFVDRLRVLVTGKLRVETRTVTENIVGESVTSSVAYPIL